MLYYDQNELKFRNAKKSLSSFITDYSDPVYIYHAAHISDRTQMLKKALPHNTEIYYALKANDNKEILRLFINLGVGMDVVSLGELTWSLEQGCEPQKIIFSGVGKTEKELTYAIKIGLRQINVESLPELKRISLLSQKLKTPVSVGLRVNPDVDVRTHPYIATGLKNNKFGIEVAALEECDYVLKSNPLLLFKGFSVHIGSQLMDLSACSEAYDKLISLIEKWKRKGYHFETLDAGGGLGIDYENFDDIKEFNLAQEWGQRIEKSWKGLSDKILVEPGRWLVAHAGVLLTRVEYIKKTSHHHFVVVDAGMNHLIRPALYQAKHRILPLIDKKKNNSNSSEEKSSVGANSLYQVVGPICESSDVLATQVELFDVQEGDFLVVLDTGAYGNVMSSHYNRRPDAREVFN